MLAACGKPMNIMALISILHLSSGGVALAADTGRIIIRNIWPHVSICEWKSPRLNIPMGRISSRLTRILSCESR